MTRAVLLTSAAMCALLGVTTTARAQSAVDGFDPGANNGVNAVVVQPDGKILVSGYFTTLGGGGTGTTVRYGIGRFNVDGTLDTSFNPGVSGGYPGAMALQPDGKILVVGSFTGLGGGTGTTTRNRIGRLNADGSLDTAFNPGANGDVVALAVQPDGKILVGGLFTALGGGTGTTTRNRIGRLNADGSLDASFDPGADQLVRAMAVQPDGKVLVGGLFTTLGGGGSGTTARRKIGRLNADGSLDASFDPIPNNAVWALAVQADGKILVGGDFTAFFGGGTTTRNYIGRINPDGSLDANFNPGADSRVVTLAVQPDGKILVGGEFTALGGGGTGTTTRNRIGRLNADGSLDASFNPGANTTVTTVAVQPDGKILVGGNFTTLGGGGTGTTTRNYIGRLNADGSLDSTFNPGANAGANSYVRALVPQPNGQILVGGYFTGLGGGTGTTPRNYLGRINADGSLDASFDPGANNAVLAMAVQPDGKILVGGYFWTLGGGGTGTVARNHIGRLNADGSLDTSFDPNASTNVTALVVQPDGKILVGGDFTALGGTTRNRIARLNADGSLDTTFDPGANERVYAVALQPDGKILVGGAFTMLGGGGTGTTPRNSIGRLNADGSLDTTFNPGASGTPPRTPDVYVLAVQADGKILVAGAFTALGGGTGATPRSRIGRLNADGSLDTTFDPGANSEIWDVALQIDGKILVGGSITMLGGGGTGTTTRNYIGRLNADGSLDATFNPGANGDVHALALQLDGKVLVGGGFTALGGGGFGTATRNYLGRLTNTGVAIQDLSVTAGSVVNWSRGGTGPEVSRVTFESSADGLTYTALGSGTRVAGGWQLTGQSVPSNQSVYIRARGYYATGYLNGSGSIVESISNAFVPATGSTILIDFEDRPDSIPFASTFASSYQGITWNNWGEYAPYACCGYDADGVNAIYALLDGSSFTFPDRVFLGASFSAPSLTAASRVFFELYDNGTLVHTSADLNSASLTFLPSGYPGLVDEVRVRTIGSLMTGAGSAWIMDDVTFAVAGSSGISGAVTNQTAAGVANILVQIYDGNSRLVGSATTVGGGSYIVSGLSAGVYFAKTANSQGYVNRLYQNVACVSCGIIGGTPIVVTAGSMTSNVNFTLGAGGAIDGTVTGPSGALAGVVVQVYSGNGQLLEIAVTDGVGHYRTAIGLTAGTYFVRTSNTLGLVDEVYNNVACVACNPITGTPVAVVGAATTTGINFALAAGGSITGTVVGTGGTPLSGVPIEVYSAAGVLVAGALTTGSGLYATTSVIPPGSYYVRTSNTVGYVNQVYKARACLDCNPTTGTAVAVVAGQPTNGIDFALTRGGRVTGTIRAVAGGAPLANVGVTIATAAGVAVATGVTDAAGVYVTSTGLPTGTYYARTSNSAGYVDEIYNDLACVSCATTVGTPIAVTAGADASGVDFGLAGGGAIAGTVVDATTSQPVANAVVQVYTSTGVLATSAVSDTAGVYLTDQILGPGRHFVRATSALGYVSEVYNNLECAACSPLTGTPVDVVGGQTTASVDFSLALGGRITGTVTDATSGQVLRDITVSIYNGNNNLVTTAQTDATGQFLTAGGLAAGTYFARTRNTQGFIDQLYSATICLVCTPNTGTGVAVALGQLTSSINFQLTPGARLAGSVIETGTNQPLGGVRISVYDKNATVVTSGLTDNAGQYQTTDGLPTGTYFARTAATREYIDKVFDNAVCLACDVTRGTAIAVTGPAIVPGVNFSLSLGGRIAGTLTSTATGAGLGNVRVAVHNTAGAFVSASYSNAAGQYETTGLPPGAYKLRTFNRQGLVDEAFDNQPCGPCPMATVGTAIPVAAATTVPGKSFALDPGGWVSGWVTDASTKAPLAGVTVAFFQNGQVVGRGAVSDASGYYGISLPVGIYAARPDPVQGYIVQFGPGLRPAAVNNVSVEAGLETPGVEFPLAACTPPAITPSTLPSGTAGQSYGQALSASGAGTYTFSLAGGELPPGLSLSDSGQIVGTPTTLGTASFTVAATDANGCSATQPYAQFTCGVSLGETAATFAAAAGTRAVTIAANADDCAWSASASASWITITKGSGAGAGTLEYAVAANSSTSVRTATLTVGTQTYTVTQNGQDVQRLRPIGSFDTPGDGVDVTGSIAVTGWALDDAGVDRVEIWRDLVTSETTQPFNSPGHPGHGKVFIARATFVRGARPDVAGIYATYPNADLAGWGYLLLTQGLWNQGNGTYALYAFAFDVDGQVTRLCATPGAAPGTCASVTKTIVVNNVRATKPFGALDTPTFGATVSGGFWNYGWALTPKPNATDGRTCAIPDGNVYVGIDSQSLVAVRYGEQRSDIAGFFPGFSNGTQAGGAFYIDTTSLSNGDHQIGWYVVDDCFRADGIGSRIFTVLNGVNIATEAVRRVLPADDEPRADVVRVLRPAGSADPSPSAVGRVLRPAGTDVVQVFRPAYNESPMLVHIDQQPRWSYPDEQGAHVIAIAQRSRIEVELPKVEGAVYRGGEIAGGAEKALPLGSSLDAERGVFYWEPAPAFLGTYDLVFAAGDRAPVRVRVVVEPQ